MLGGGHDPYKLKTFFFVDFEKRAGAFATTTKD